MADKRTASGFKVAPCTCEPAIRDSSQQLKTYSQLGHLDRMTFDTIRPEGRRGRVDESMFRIATDAAMQFSANPRGWLVFEGSTGSGKTHLAAAIVNAIIDRGSASKFVSALDIPELITNERFGETDAENGTTFESLLECPVLVIDDLGAQRTADWVDSKIDKLMTHRFNAQYPTVVVLAKPIDELPARIALKLDDPSFSNVFRLTVADTAASDFRINIPKSMLERMTFETFDSAGSPASKPHEKTSIGMAKATAQAFAENPTKWLYLHGSTGVGKTHLAVAIANVCTLNGLEVTCWSVSDLLDRFRQSFSSHDGTAFYQIFDTVRNAGLLILDDFGSQNLTDWALEKLYQLLCYRHDRHLPTVVTSQFVLWDGVDNSNWNRVQGKQQWESIKSRLNDSNVVTERFMTAPDYRDRGA